MAAAHGRTSGGSRQGPGKIGDEVRGLLQSDGQPKEAEIHAGGGDLLDGTG